jgi:hypothetical protein
MKVLSALCLAAALALGAMPHARAEAPGGAAAGSSAGTHATQLSAAQRSAVVRELVEKWRSEVKKNPAGDVKAWSAKLAKVVATADAANVLRATTMTSLEMVHAALNGHVPDNSKVQSSRALGNGAVAPHVIGSTIADTAYTPLPNGRCRVADSRVIASPIGAGQTRAIDTEAVVDYSFQGGNGTYANGNGSTNCGLPEFATAVAVSVTLLSPAVDGVFKVFVNGAAFQTGNSILFNAGDYGANGDLIVISCQTCTAELAIQSSAQIHYVIDVIGYFMPPQATALQCVDTADEVGQVAAGATINVMAPQCSAGYTPTATNCESSTWQMPFVYFSAGTCSAQNNSPSQATVRANRTCCRVPGR